ncbi:hypothetical protein CMV_012442 [Castanea mollissima]|uniref:non-specific serine/threonine protein kinase n=1 Tax=Castanea mollissima TaxID=60419 RepID=A0A8J4R9I3_9ROSI|nr:hypothetical protein CMV_012442 [Castanea mollissima]
MGGSGCLLWFGNLVDIREIAKDAEDQFYVRLAASELDHVEKKRRSSKKKQAGIIIGSALSVLGMIIIGLVTYIWKKKLRNQAMTKGNLGKECDNMGRKEDIELSIFDLTAIANATDNFSNNKKLGEGGFGSVYKGTLLEGKEIAVKRLSKNSGQGVIELKTEVILISKLQHRNLVKLLGYCIEENEKMLIYEYMPNKSLDSLIFDQTKSKLLNWHKRFNIIVGTSAWPNHLGEIKVMPRPIGLLEHIHGQYSTKSDVFSFGVLILEIVSGKKNRGFSHPEHHHNLLGHAWRLWIEAIACPTILLEQEAFLERVFEIPFEERSWKRLVNLDTLHTFYEGPVPSKEAWDPLKNKQAMKNRQEEIKKAATLRAQGGGSSALPLHVSKKRKHTSDVQSLSKGASGSSTHPETHEVAIDAPRHGIGKDLISCRIAIRKVPYCCGFSTGTDSTSSLNNDCDSDVVLVGGLGAGVEVEDVVDM